MNDVSRLTTVDYCVCEHLAIDHREETFTDDTGTILRFNACTVRLCNCFQYIKGYTLGYIDFFVVDEKRKK